MIIRSTSLGFMFMEEPDDPPHLDTRFLIILNIFFLLTLSKNSEDDLSDSEGDEGVMMS